ncbi:hypothetical protein PVK06_042805 [Gossypium arboreum]|uniref:Uncharacterized protein n=1 Tax=Gossypium arboreum TaxID=29729 RepID=A0ABR0MLT8_GOSAR|nr:hypothetical protein PVK06_042805 [Gossypium arboreum]
MLACFASAKLDKTPHLYGEVMSMEVEGFDDNFFCSVFDYLVGRESETKALLAEILATNRLDVIFSSSSKRQLAAKLKLQLEANNNDLTRKNNKLLRGKYGSETVQIIAHGNKLEGFDAKEIEPNGHK